MTMTRQEADTYRSRVRGSLLGGAIGDALGGPVEFQNVAKILADHGENGVRGFVGYPDGAPAGTITDDTQMTLFTAEGLLRAGNPPLDLAAVHASYDEWLDTQYKAAPPGPPDGALRTEPWLYVRRAPGRTCLDALTAARGGADRIARYGEVARNDSKGCGGVMRVAPIGLLPPFTTVDRIFDSAALAAGFTHGHPTGQLAAGALAAILHGLVRGADLDTALDSALLQLVQRGDQETLTALRAARELARHARGVDAVESLGGGWVAEEALAIAVYAALLCPRPDPDQVLAALSVAVTHSGDSDSTGAICGNLLGAWHGESALPPDLVRTVEGRATITRLADDLATMPILRHQ